MKNLPTGTITLLFTDIEGSKRLLQQLVTATRDVLATYHRLLRPAMQEAQDQVVDHGGMPCSGPFPGLVGGDDDAQAAPSGRPD